VGINLAAANLLNVENATLTGFKDFDVSGNGLANILRGNESDNDISGNDGDDTLIGGGGSDHLDGGTGKDTMSGGSGDEIYFVDNALDVIIEAAGEGNDFVLSTVSYTLSANLEDLFLDAANIDGTGNALNNRIDGTGGVNKLDGAAGNDKLFGNGSDDTLIGGAGNDTLDGGTGNDAMTGGLGDDAYKVDSLNDKVSELAGQGTDTIIASINLDLTKSDNVENLTYEGAADFVGFGNALNNSITGGSGNDLLDGDIGNDTLSGGVNNDFLVGGIGNDLLDGGTGNDTLEGGAGNDVYVLAGTDTIFEDPNQGIDEVRTERHRHDKRRRGQ
jgi:Ca2+-binding RTX toxin-like protein